MLNESVFEKPMLSLWLKDGIGVDLKTLTENEETDVLVVGAGITGITTAYLLNKKGIDVILIDKSAPLSLTTGNTTAKLTFQHSLIYKDIMNNYGIDEAMAYHRAQNVGIRLVEDIIHEHNIDCDYLQTYACIYTKNKSDIESLKDEQNVYQKMGVQSELVFDDPYNLGYSAALRVDNQFQFNPVKYLSSMLKYLLEKNVRIYKDTMALDIKGEGPFTVQTKTGHDIQANSVVVATGYPFFDAKSLYFSKLEPSRSYLTAYEIEGSQPYQGMFLSLDEDSAYSVRFSDTDGLRYLLVGGQGHNVGQIESEMEGYRKLISFASKHFNVQELAYRWSAQDYKSVDKIPYIGEISSNYKDVYIASGFNKWGMTNGSFAAALITSLIQDKKQMKDEIIEPDYKNSYLELFSPSRPEISSNIGTFLKTNMNVAKELVKSKFASSDMELSELENNHGAVTRKGFKKLAAYRDNYGTVHAYSAACTHMGCGLKYNDAEKSFDCPCHGSRFSSKGDVIEGPAKKRLESEDIK